MERRELLRLEEPLVPARGVSRSRPAPGRAAGTFRRRRFLLGAGLVALALLALAACEGDNVFSNESEYRDPIVMVVAPSLVFTNDEFQVQVFAQAPRGLARIDVSILNAFYKDTSFVSTNGTTGVASQIFRFRAPESFFVNTMVVQARVLDRTGRTSVIMADTADALPR